ncbi:hypothetical protein HX071_08700 [Myroides marinus]|uniref:hypothetical protein n=2 Tax=Myroides TaxID=76831 RepID=UPI00257679A0|nr:hypothetical protein [Myroides marinus]MDM1502283.1 hypothetical protein [Myroides marinus]
MEIEARIENDFYIKEWNRLTGEGKIIFKHPKEQEYQLHSYDWYMIVALEKATQVTQDRSKLTYSLLVKYRNAIREGYNHELDPFLKNRFDYPRNQNTISGIEKYIERIFKKQTSHL